MAHIRKQLRDKMKMVVQGTGITTFVNRDKQITQTDLPCAVITTDRDKVDPFIGNGNQAGCSRRTLRVIDLVIRVYAQAETGVDDALDAQCAKIEKALADTETIAPAWPDLESTTIDIFGEGEKPIGIATMNYKVEFKNISNPERSI